MSAMLRTGSSGLFTLQIEKHPIDANRHRRETGFGPTSCWTTKQTRLFPSQRVINRPLTHRTVRTRDFPDFWVLANRTLLPVAPTGVATRLRSAGFLAIETASIQSGKIGFAQFNRTSHLISERLYSARSKGRSTKRLILCCLLLQLFIFPVFCPEIACQVPKPTNPLLSNNIRVAF